MTAQGTYAPDPAAQYDDANGDPAVNYRLFTYLAGTSTKVNTYTDIALSSANANPLTLGADARPTVMLTPGVSYKFVLALPGIDDPPASVLWTRDNIQSVPGASTSADVDVVAVAGENIAANDCCYLSDGTGGTTAGRWYRTDADAVATSVTAQLIGFATAAITSGATGAVRTDGRVTGLTGLVAGTVYWISGTVGAITSTAPASARAVLQADTTTTGIIIPGEPYAGTGVPGVWGMGAQTMPTGVKTIPTAPVLSAGATFTSGATIIDVAVARQTADVTKNANVTVANLTGLSFAIGASQTWFWQASLFGNSNAAADYRFSVTGPAAPTAVWYGFLTANDPFATSGAANAFATEVLASSTGGNELILASGTIRNGANAGTVQLQFAQGTSNASDSKIFTDSHLMAWRIA